MPVTRGAICPCVPARLPAAHHARLKLLISFLLSAPPAQETAAAVSVQREDRRAAATATARALAFEWLSVPNVIWSQPPGQGGTRT